MTQLDQLRIGPRRTLAPGDIVRLEGKGSKLFRVTSIAERNGHLEVNLWGPVLRNGGSHQRAMQRTVAPEQIVSKARL